ncbi:putative permease [Granulicella aggregans]|uniref:Putative permease n=1 Tax=Granulicella aggregans TaxID=474949 RepID=A0A7W7ZBS8_9BACT|nr:ABC transporter permease [Granulicella aggregans]MBB5056877.1 putative permease [Granulicella aggregans]
MFTVMQDVRFAFRQLRKSLGFTLMATLTLALGIGAATAVFSLVDAVLLRPLNFPRPERIVALDSLRQTSGEGAVMPNDVSYPNFFDWRDKAKSFRSMASWQGQSFTLSSSNGQAQRIDGMAVSAEFFRVLGVGPALGREFARDEERAGNRSVIVSHGLWQSALNGDAGAIGKTIQLSDETYTVVGVMPSSFEFPNAPDAKVWVTPSQAMEGKNASGTQRGWNQLSAIGRLADGVSIAQARAEMQTIQLALAAQYPDDNKLETAVSVKPQLEELVGDVHRPLGILFGAVCFLLLIACANVAGLLLTRTAARKSELALRSALGATRLEIVRQLLVESLAVSFLGGAAGLALASAALRVASQFLPNDLPRLNELALNARVFGFSLAASLVTGILFGVLPAWRSSRLDPALALNDSTRSSTASRGQNRLHSLLVIGETALGLMLLIGAGLLIRSFDRLMSVDPGFNKDHLIAFRVGMPPKRFQDDRLLQLTQRLQERFAKVPGVASSTYGFPLPLAGGDMSISFTIDGRPNAQGEDPTARASVVAANFFQSLQMPLRRGRLFSELDARKGSAPTMIVNQAFANRFFPGEDALGKRIASGLSSDDKSQSREVVGVVGNVVRTSLAEEPKPEYFIPFEQVPLGPPVFALRVTGDPVKYVDTVRAVVAEIDPSLPVFGVRTNLLTRSTAQQKFQTLLISGFAVIALALSAIGLYAVLSYMVEQRTMELGLRIALGAQRGNVLTLILNRGMALAVAGLVVGLGASFALTRYMATLLFATKAVDAGTFAGMTALLFGVSVIACLVPAYRASRLDPMETLRSQ